MKIEEIEPNFNKSIFRTTPKIQKAKMGLFSPYFSQNKHNQQQQQQQTSSLLTNSPNTAAGLLLSSQQQQQQSSSTTTTASTTIGDQTTTTTTTTTISYNQLNCMSSSDVLPKSPVSSSSILAGLISPNVNATSSSSSLFLGLN